MKWAHVVSLTHSKEINSSTAELPLTVSYEGTSLRTFRFWVHLHDVVYSLRQFGEIFVSLSVSEVILHDLIGRRCFPCSIVFKKSLNQQNHLYFSRLHRWIHRRDQRNLVQFQPLRVRNGCTRHNCASKIRPCKIRYQAAQVSVHIRYKVMCFSSACLWVIGP